MKYPHLNIDGHLPSVARHAQECAESHEPNARLIGNCRADDLAAIFRRFLLHDFFSKADNNEGYSTCQTCQGRGVVGGTVGQTAESYEERIEDCPDCGKQPQTTKP